MATECTSVLRALIKATDEFVDAVQGARRVDSWNVDGPGSRKQAAYDRLARADRAYAAASEQAREAIAALRARQAKP